MTPSPLTAGALYHAGFGWRVVPVAERGKAPWVADWPNAATTDHDQIGRWWAERPGSNVGVALGTGSRLVGVDVDTEEGGRLLAEMSGGDLPDTVEMTTGKGSRLLYRIPDGLPAPPKTVVVKGADGKEAVRFQSDGGQCVVPPSVHPNGKVYAYVEGRSPSDLAPTEMPLWMRMTMCPPERPPEPFERAAAATFAPGGDLNRRGSWDELLAQAGFTPAGRRGEVRYFTRPGKGGGVSVTLGYYKARDGTPALYVFSGSIPELPPDKCYDLFGAYTRLHHGGDFAAASRALEAKGFGERRPPPPPKGTGQPAAAVAFAPDLVKASDVKAERIPWLWKNRIPAGRASLIAGRGGLGKTVLLCEMAATVSRGRFWPDGHQSPRGDTLILSAEDDPADTLVPRLRAAEADLDRVHFLRGAWATAADGRRVEKQIDLRDGLDQIAAAVDQLPDLKLVFVDPVGSYLGRGTDSHRDNEVRDSIGGIGRLAARCGFAVVFVAHNNKSTLNSHADDSVLGSRAFTAAVRAVHHLLQDPNDKTRLLLMPGKCNLSIAPTGLAYRLDRVDVPPVGEHPRVSWCPEQVEGSANDFFGGGSGQAPGRGGHERKEAGDLLADLLAEGPLPVDDIKRQASAAGLSWTTVKRAKAEAGVGSKAQGGAFEPGKPPRWYWGLGDAWEVPAASAEGGHAGGSSPISQHVGPPRETDGRKTAKTAEFPEEDQRAKRTGPPRPLSLFDPKRVNPADPPRGGPTDSGPGPPRESEGESLVSPEEDQPACETGDSAQVGGVATPPVWDDDETFLAALKAAGKKWPDAVDWLNAAHAAYPPGVRFHTVSSDHRRLAFEWLGAGAPEPPKRRKR